MLFHFSYFFKEKNMKNHVSSIIEKSVFNAYRYWGVSNAYRCTIHIGYGASLILKYMDITASI